MLLFKQTQHLAEKNVFRLLNPNKQIPMTWTEKVAQSFPKTWNNDFFALQAKCEEMVEGFGDILNLCNRHPLYGSATMRLMFKDKVILMAMQRIDETKRNAFAEGKEWNQIKHLSDQERGEYLINLSKQEVRV
jgi:hypothetical protein